VKTLFILKLRITKYPIRCKKKLSPGVWRTNQNHHLLFLFRYFVQKSTPNFGRTRPSFLLQPQTTIIATSHCHTLNQYQTPILTAVENPITIRQQQQQQLPTQLHLPLFSGIFLFSCREVNKLHEIHMQKSVSNSQQQQQQQRYRNSSKERMNQPTTTTTIRLYYLPVHKGRAAAALKKG
jgi:hypothetical protein